MAKLVFEDLENIQPNNTSRYLYRAKVPNGWIVSSNTTFVFVPDENHEWI